MCRMAEVVAGWHLRASVVQMSLEQKRRELFGTVLAHDRLERARALVRAQVLPRGDVRAAAVVAHEQCERAGRAVRIVVPQGASPLAALVAVVHARAAHGEQVRHLLDGQAWGRHVPGSVHPARLGGAHAAQLLGRRAARVAKGVALRAGGHGRFVHAQAISADEVLIHLRQEECQVVAHGGQEEAQRWFNEAAKSVA